MHLDMSMGQHFLFMASLIYFCVAIVIAGVRVNIYQYLEFTNIRSLQILKAHEMDSTIGLLFLAKFNMRYRQTDGKYLCFMTLTDTMVILNQENVPYFLQTTRSQDIWKSEIYTQVTVRVFRLLGVWMSKWKATGYWDSSRFLIFRTTRYAKQPTVSEPYNLSRALNLKHMSFVQASQNLESALAILTDASNRIFNFSFFVN